MIRRKGKTFSQNERFKKFILNQKRKGATRKTHGVFGKGDLSLMGCIRANTEVYLILEVVIFEISGVNAVRQFNETLGLKALELTPKD